MKFISASVFMEAFNFYWAKNVGQLTPSLKANGLIRGFVSSVNLRDRREALFTFEELLALACSDLGLAPCGPEGSSSPPRDRP